MDSLRGDFGSNDRPDEHGEDEIGYDAPPPAIGTDERRMQVRAYNFWASLLDGRNFPGIDDLDPASLPDFGPHGVLLDFSRGIDNPLESFLGHRLAGECGIPAGQITRLSDVPSLSLLSRITDHYMQILANQAPIGFEAEFVNHRGATIVYRGILLPFSSDDETIDFIFGVINWKELADAQTADELLLEIDQALDSMHPLGMTGELADWADGPASPVPLLPETSGGGPESSADRLPVPSFGLLASDSDDAFADTGQMTLADWLALARDQALQARSSEDRTRAALYGAIGRAYDFALAAADAPDEFARLVADAGLSVQARAPMLPVVKLVFGTDYDKTRLTEYATALTHARRVGLGRGELATYLARAEGGLKGVIAQERNLRRNCTDVARVTLASGPRKTIARKLRAMTPVPFDAIPRKGAEFALLMVRRTAEGEVVVLGEVPDDVALVEKAARKLAN
ncbi:MAG: hypothetical protein N2Z59_03370 [Alteraurantiacibacter sp.]|nr:hypothetical protein [Alteraurantiacibacter sp.]